MTKRVWDDYLTEQDKAHLEIIGPKKRKGFGSKPAVLNIDNYRSVSGDEPMDILEMIKTWPGSMGYAAWEALDNIADLLATAREAGMPIAHVRGLSPDSGMPGRVHPDDISDPEKRDRAIRGREFMPQAAPLAGEIVLEKASASAFFSTPLMAALNAYYVDTLIITGESTSGCVRASVIDATSYRFKVIIAEECVYDRHQACHAINLFDMNQKYADVMPLAEIKEWIAEWAAGKAGSEPQPIAAV
jgi:nicotinamidase-related amidase